MKRFLLVLVLLTTLVPTTLHAQEPSPSIIIKPENRCSPYNRDHYPYPQSVEDGIIARMGGRIYSPYTGESFTSKRETDIEHMVATSEAHDSGLCAASAATRRAFARDLDNLTLASPALNRYQKVAKDVAEWLPVQNQCWFVARVVAIKKKYGLSMDAREAAAALNVLADCVNLEMKFVSPITTRPSATPTQSGSTGFGFTVNRDAVNVRSGPGTNYSIIGAVRRGQTYTANGRNQAATWLRFPWRGSYGWVAAWLMTVEGVENVPVVQAPPTSTPVSAPASAPTNTPTPAHTPALERDAQYYKNLCGVGQRGWVTIALARRCGFSMPVCRSTNPGLYEAMHDGDGDGCVGE